MNNFYGVTTKNHGCLKMVVGYYEISIAFDDSCQEDGIIRRSDIRIYEISKNSMKYEYDVTDDVIKSEFPEQPMIYGNIESLLKVIEYCKNN